MMKHWLISLCLALILMVSLTGCQAIADIFQAGVWVGVIISVVVIALIIYLVKVLVAGR